MQPRSDQELLPVAGVRTALMMPALKTQDGALVHEVVPASDRKAGDIHLVEVQGAILLPPIVVVGGMAKPLFQEPAVVLRTAANLVHGQKSLRPGRAANAITFLKQTQPRIDHVLAFQMRWLRDGQKVLGISTLRAAERSDAGAPRLLGEPFARVIAVL